MVELYDQGTVSLLSSSSAKLVNISPRGRVQAGDGAMIGGFIVHEVPAKLVVRALGPSLTALGIDGALADSTVEVIDGFGSTMFANDDWATGDGNQRDQLIASGLQPKNDREAAVIATLPPGNYTAIVRGKGGSTGVALIEVYVLQ